MMAKVVWSATGAVWIFGLGDIWHSMNMFRRSQKFDESKHKRNKRGEFVETPNKGQPQAAAAHQVDLTASG